MAKISIHSKAGTQKINRHIYGHFAEHLGRCIYDGIWVGEDSPIPNTRGIRNDIVAALKQINVPNLRWPGGCFADIYDWRDGIGAKESRPTRLNFWGNVPETNAFGTHEFMDLCEQIGCEAYFGGNVGSGNVREMRDWIEYLTSDNEASSLANERRQNGRNKAWSIPFWGIGNENWGCGGNMTPEYYADLYCQYQNFIRNYSDKPMMKIASGYGGSDTAGDGLAIFMDKITNRRHPVRTDGISIHYYVFLRDTPQHHATEFDESDWFTVLKQANQIGDVIEKNSAILDQYDPEKRMWLIIDEWGTWYPPVEGLDPAFLWQQNTMRDAVVAALSLHIFQAHADRVQMANIAQTVNVLQAMILTEGEKMLLTPSYHVFDMLKGHQDATLLPLDLDVPAYQQGNESLPTISASASKAANGEILLTLCNLHPTEAIHLDCRLDTAISSIKGQILLGDAIQAHNSFDNPNRVEPKPYTGAILQDSQQISFDLPPASVLALTMS
jgi:alpha-L-arabinofuranosidase